MTKCDTVKSEADLVKVTQQISRELARRPLIAPEGMTRNNPFPEGKVAARSSTPPPHTPALSDGATPAPPVLPAPSIDCLIKT